MDRHSNIYFKLHIKTDILHFCHPIVKTDEKHGSHPKPNGIMEFLNLNLRQCVKKIPTPLLAKLLISFF
jgi:hypothetical protein